MLNSIVIQKARMPVRGPAGEKGNGPSMRLNVKKAQVRSAPSGTSAPRSSKKRRFEPPPASTSPNTSQVGDLKLLHQKSDISFYLHRPSNSYTSQATWYANAVTRLYVLQDELPALCSHLSGPPMPGRHRRGP